MNGPVSPLNFGTPNAHDGSVLQNCVTNRSWRVPADDTDAGVHPARTPAPTMADA